MAPTIAYSAQWRKYHESNAKLSFDKSRFLSYRGNKPIQGGKIQQLMKHRVVFSCPLHPANLDFLKRKGFTPVAIRVSDKYIKNATNDPRRRDARHAANNDVRAMSELRDKYVIPSLSGVHKEFVDLINYASEVEGKVDTSTANDKGKEQMRS